jgi:hypothetical protein
MKYLKKFNEKLNLKDRTELLDFCETTLAYLIDERFSIDCTFTNVRDGVIKIDLEKVDGFNQRSSFLWDDVKDYYIPFLQLLNNRYDIIPYGNRTKNNVCFDTFFHEAYFSVEDVIADRVRDFNGDEFGHKDKTHCISVKVKEKK